MVVGLVCFGGEAADDEGVSGCWLYSASGSGLISAVADSAIRTSASERLDRKVMLSMAMWWMGGWCRAGSPPPPAGFEYGLNEVSCQRLSEQTDAEMEAGGRWYGWVVRRAVKFVGSRVRT